MKLQARLASSLVKGIDSWFEKIRSSHLKGRAEIVRFADDLVFVFELKEDADRFYEVLPKRLEKYGLKLNEKKSSKIRTGSGAAEEAHQRGEKIPTYKFLGFTCYWGQSRNGWWRLKYKSRSDRFSSKLQGLKSYLKKSLSAETSKVLDRVKRIVRGWINYHAISDNQRKVNSFIHQSVRILFNWINRKGGKRKMNWTKFEALLKQVDYPRTYKTTSMFQSC